MWLKVFFFTILSALQQFIKIRKIFIVVSEFIRTNIL